MKSFVYNLNDYRLRAVLDEENFATLYYYDEEGNLYLTKQETAKGIKIASQRGKVEHADDQMPRCLFLVFTGGTCRISAGCFVDVFTSLWI